MREREQILATILKPNSCIKSTWVAITDSRLMYSGLGNKMVFKRFDLQLTLGITLISLWSQEEKK